LTEITDTGPIPAGLRPFRSCWMITARFGTQKERKGLDHYQIPEPTAKNTIDIPDDKDFNYVPYRVGKTGRDVRGIYL
jgi:hypothetical protein